MQNDIVAIAKKTIDDILDLIEELNINDEFDVDFRDEVLTVETSKGGFVINYHSSANQIWLSSPISGPHHFSYNFENSSWNNRHKEDLKSLILKEFTDQI